MNEPLGDLVVGLGNPMRGDDGIGPAVVAALRQLPVGGDVDLVTSDQDGPALLELWTQRPLVIVVDAVRSGAPPGTVHRLAEQDLAGWSARAASPTTHRVGLPATADLARVLDRRPQRLVVYGVEIAHVELGHQLSPAVASALPTVVDQVERELAVR